MGLLEIPNKKQIITKLILFAFILIIISTVSGLILINHHKAFFLKIFYVNNDDNIPRWFSSIILFLGGMLSYLIYLSDKMNNKTIFSWGTLSFIFIFLSIAKSTSIDQSLFSIARRDLSIMGFHINSFLFGLILILLFITFFVRFYLKLNKEIRKSILTAAIIYIPISLFFGILSSISYLYHTPILYIVFSGIEEFCEMTGSIVFIYALLLQMELINFEKLSVLKDNH